jgi:hypothetical protein
MFSSPALAMEAPSVREVIGLSTGKERTPGLLICQLSGKEDFYFTIEI